MRKKLLLIPLIVVTSLSVTGCFIFDSDGHVALENFKMVLDCIESDEKEKLKDLFAPVVKDEVSYLDSQIDDLFEYYIGEHVSTAARGLGLTGPIENGKVIKIFEMFYTAISSDFAYFFKIQWCIRDDWDSNNVGIWSMIVERCEDFEAVPTPLEEWTKGIVLI